MSVREEVHDRESLDRLADSIRKVLQTEGGPIIVEWGTPAGMGVPTPPPRRMGGPIFHDGVYRPSAPSGGWSLRIQGPGYGVDAHVEDPVALLDFIRQITASITSGLIKEKA